MEYVARGGAFVRLRIYCTSLHVPFLCVISTGDRLHNCPLIFNRCQSVNDSAKFGEPCTDRKLVQCSFENLLAFCKVTTFFEF